MPPHSLDVQYQDKNGGPPQRLSDIAARADELIDAVAEAMVNDGTDFMLEAIKQETPVSEDPGVEGYEYIPGGDGVHLKDSMKRTEADVHGDVWEASAGTDKEYAPFVDEGTGLYGPKHAKYLIVPHKPGGYLAWPGADGAMHYARAVWHPGSEGAHFMMKGKVATEGAVKEWRTRGDAIFKEGMKG